jgi:hypothetical protein
MKSFSTDTVHVLVTAPTQLLLVQVTFSATTPDILITALSALSSATTYSVVMLSASDVYYAGATAASVSGLFPSPAGFVMHIDPQLSCLTFSYSATSDAVNLLPKDLSLTAANTLFTTTPTTGNLPLTSSTLATADAVTTSTIP